MFAQLTNMFTAKNEIEITQKCTKVGWKEEDCITLQ